MPWKIETKDGKHCVIKESTGETLKCYSDKGSATAYLRALYAHSGDKTLAELSLVKEFSVGAPQPKKREADPPVLNKRGEYLFLSKPHPAKE